MDYAMLRREIAEEQAYIAQHKVRIAKYEARLQNPAVKDDERVLIERLLDTMHGGLCEMERDVLDVQQFLEHGPMAPLDEFVLDWLERTRCAGRRGSPADSVPDMATDVATAQHSGHPTLHAAAASDTSSRSALVSGVPTGPEWTSVLLVYSPSASLSTEGLEEVAWLLHDVLEPFRRDFGGFGYAATFPDGLHVDATFPAAGQEAFEECLQQVPFKPSKRVERHGLRKVKTDADADGNEHYVEFHCDAPMPAELRSMSIAS